MRARNVRAASESRRVPGCRSARLPVEREAYPVRALSGRCTPLTKLIFLTDTAQRVERHDLGYRQCDPITRSWVNVRVQFHRRELLPPRRKLCAGADTGRRDRKSVV